MESETAGKRRQGGGKIYWGGLYFGPKSLISADGFERSMQPMMWAMTDRGILLKTRRGWVYVTVSPEVEMEIRDKCSEVVE